MSLSFAGTESRRVFLMMTRKISGCHLRQLLTRLRPKGLNELSALKKSLEYSIEGFKVSEDYLLCHNSIFIFLSKVDDKF